MSSKEIRRVTPIEAALREGAEITLTGKLERDQWAAWAIDLRRAPSEVARAIRIVEEAASRREGAMGDPAEAPTVKKEVEGRRHMIFNYGGVFYNFARESVVFDPAIQVYTGIPPQLEEVLDIPLARAVGIWQENRERLLTGRETPREFLSRISKELGLRVDIHTAYSAWTELYQAKEGQLDRRLIQLVEQLKRTYDIHIHIHTDTIALDPGKPAHAMFPLFEHIFRSYEIGYKKTNEQAFVYVLNALRTKPEECILIDDSAGNIEVAEGLGIKSLLFRTVDQLKQDLARLGFNL